MNACCSPTPHITWSLSGSNQSLQGPRYKLSDFGTRLTIHKLLPSDGGQYTCTGANVAGSHIVTFELHVLGQFYTFSVLNNVNQYYMAIFSWQNDFSLTLLQQQRIQSVWITIVWSEPIVPTRPPTSEIMSFWCQFVGPICLHSSMLFSLAHEMNCSSIACCCTVICLLNFRNVARMHTLKSQNVSWSAKSG